MTRHFTELTVHAVQKQHAGLAALLQDHLSREAHNEEAPVQVVMDRHKQEFLGKQVLALHTIHCLNT